MKLGSPSRASTITSRARRNCWRARWSAGSNGCSACWRNRARSGTPLERLRHIVYRSVIITLEFVQEVELLQRVKGNTPTERRAMARRRRFDREVAALVRQAAAAGQIDTNVDGALLTRLIFGMGNSITQWYRREGRLKPEQIAEAMSRLVFEGIVRNALG